MGLFSFSRKNQQQSSTGNSDFYSQADEETSASRKRRQGKKREDAVDPLLPQKKRARRRLIGAVALVLAVIIGLPMILDPEPKPLSDDIAIQIPSKDNASSRTQDSAKISSESTPSSTNAALKANEKIVDDTATVASTDKPEQAPQSVTKPSQVTPSANLKTPAEAPSTADAAEEAAKAKATAEAEKKAEETARARAILTGKVPSVATPPASGKVVVQVAALSTQEKVDELQKKLKDAGLKSYTEKVNTASGVWTRVRIGPFASDAEAESVRAKLIKIGLNGKLLPV
tara:strand:+ start:5641 stop:6501 length:861 start_codon:yes stop_codon:yes gene_type:complete